MNQQVFPPPEAIRPEEFLNFMDFCALQMAEFHGPAFDGSGNKRERANVFRVAVAVRDFWENFPKTL